MGYLQLFSTADPNQEADVRKGGGRANVWSRCLRLFRLCRSLHLSISPRAPRQLQLLAALSRRSIAPHCRAAARSSSVPHQSVNSRAVVVRPCNCGGRAGPRQSVTKLASVLSSALHIHGTVSQTIMDSYVTVLASLPT